VTYIQIERLLPWHWLETSVNPRPTSRALCLLRLTGTFIPHHLKL
jgi:hypothetical protein